MRPNNKSLIFPDIVKSRYLAQVSKVSPKQQERVRDATAVILSLIALSILGIFAINPTLTTIFTLQKQLADAQYTRDQLETKIQNLETLQNKYAQLSPDLPLVMSALPTTPTVTDLTGKLQALASTDNITVTDFTITSVPLMASSSATTSFVFNLQGTGTASDITSFLSGVTAFDRIVTFDEMGVTRDLKTNTLRVTVTGKAYTQK